MTFLPHFSYRHFVVMILVLVSINLQAVATTIEVDSQTLFDNALTNVSDNDTIAWKDGTFENIYMNIERDHIVILALNPGSAIFKGASRIVVKGSHVTILGLQFLDGDIGTKNVIDSYGSYNIFDNINISGYTSYKYLTIDELSQYNTVSYCNFENRLNQDDKNILSVLVDANQPGYHLIQYCSFKNFDGIGQDMGVEPIRIGLSTQGEFISRTIVEYCYFTQCNGDGEIISNKARQNVFRYNTFEDNPKAELVLRHGDEGVVYGNFFLNGMGGIRVKEGQNHVIYNNYFSGLTERSLILQNYGVDPLDNILIAYNTFVESDIIRLGGSGSYPPQNVVIANNVMSRQEGNLFYDPTDTETWIGNIVNGSLGIDGQDGIRVEDPKLEMNSQGYYSPSSSSPVIDAATEGYPSLPVYEGLDIDSEILLDLMKGTRPPVISQKDVGATEYTETGFVQPHVSERNTGPAYFRKNVTLSVDPMGLGSISIEPDLEEYEKGTIVTLTATPTDGYEFYYWSGDKTSILNPDTLIMNNDRMIFANFQSIVAIPVSLTEHNMEAYPNPVGNQLNLSVNELSGKSFKIYLYDYHGRVIKVLDDLGLKAVDPISTYDISDIPSGVYFLGLTEAENTGALARTIKLIKE